MTTSLTLISHTLCPYVQRAAIVLAEKEIPFERIMIDLANKPDWFRTASPLGKVPLLKTGDRYLFESAPIVEYLDETTAPKLHPDEPLERARHRAYVEFASQTLNGIGALYSAQDDTGFAAASAALTQKFRHLEDVIAPGGPFFAGSAFSLVDAAFAPVFRYFDVFESFLALDILERLDKVSAWRHQLSQRPSVRNAVSGEYPDLLRGFLRKKNSWMSHLLDLHERRESTAMAC
ncbi:glutathione S-transferase family protein [Labrenzia sp. VG12]|uniref:glutathione S-transferase family protein n=1 Tax=Labrenzia sp. VG12 TaxID=2021862 RepID=UPI000B8C62B1|nr:glutathione S-transferase family protein [Labrenzia sp. VG12]ASP36233.1 glutathione S-transferase [Labrenzia sp. VG12]